MTKRKANNYEQRFATVEIKAMNDRTIAELEKHAARTKAEEVIYAHISKWADREISVGAEVPILQAGRGFGSLTSTVLGGVSEVHAILDAATVLNKAELKRRVEELDSLLKTCEAAQVGLVDFDYGMMAKAEYGGKGLHKSVEGRVVNAIGPARTAYLSLDIIAAGLREQVTLTELTLRDDGGANRVGRAKDEAAYRVALTAAKLYARIIGEKPTYSQGSGGLSGKYTPFLRDLFDAFGWPRRSLRGPAEKAIESLGSGDYLPPQIGLGHMLSAGFSR